LKDSLLAAPHIAWRVSGEFQSHSRLIIKPRDVHSSCLLQAQRQAKTLRDDSGIGHCVVMFGISSHTHFEGVPHINQPGIDVRDKCLRCALPRSRWFDPPFGVAVWKRRAIPDAAPPSHRQFYRQALPVFRGA
jgi:hypothetical protein